MTEHQEQAALMKLCAAKTYQYPDLAYIFAIPNGGQRNLVTAARLKAEGVKPGIPDLFLAVPKGDYHGMFIEMKARQNGKLSVHQKACIASFKRRGYACVVAYGWEEAWAEIVKYITITDN